jgi:hypothetical protein
MPKDATKNVDRYKVRGGTLNEFEFSENQEEFSDQKGKAGGKLIPGTAPEKRAATRKSAKKKASVAAGGASAKKLASKKTATKKTATKKKAAKKK